ncbi:MAG: AAA family ATPase, partial [Pseudomonadota bacterium]
GGLKQDTVLYQLVNRHIIHFVEAYAEGRRVILIIDEAQNLGFETLEELRMLTNINSGKDELLQLILVGQVELRALIERPELRQFAQRVTSTYHLMPLDPATVREYIIHRLKAVGGTGGEIDDRAIQAVVEQSQGIPRIINKICDLALVYAASAGQDKVNDMTINELIQDGVLLQTTRTPLFLTDRVDLPKSAAE